MNFHIQGVLLGSPAIHAAGLLRDELALQGVESESTTVTAWHWFQVWADLVIWTDGMVYRWWAGRVSLRTGWRLYAVYGVDNPATAARGVALRYAELRESHPPPS